MNIRWFAQLLIYNEHSKGEKSKLLTGLGFFVTFLKWLLYQEPIDPKESVPRE
jgi:hypothetical protein